MASLGEQGGAARRADLAFAAYGGERFDPD